jgi:uncharacterized protein YaaR (DUF327 family)
MPPISIRMKSLEESITGSINWLDKHKDSNNILNISKVIDNLAIKSATLGEMVSEAYALMNEAEDDYKISVAKFMSEATSSAAKAERDAEAKYAEQKRHWTACKNTYKKLDNFLERIDKICESHRQRISIMKMAEMKNI